MGKLADIDFDRKYNKLKMLREVEPQFYKNGKMKRMVEVLCDCGVVCTKSYQDVRRSATKSCGTCPRDHNVIDISGMVVNRLTVLETFTRVDGSILWDCLCKCGNRLQVDGVRLRNKTVVNCGKCGTKGGAYYIGDKFKNNEDYTVTIIGIKEDRVVTVQYNDEFNTIIDMDYVYLKAGTFKNPNHRSVAGVGYFGIGRFIAKAGERHTPEYEKWNSMMKRCYKATEERGTTYLDKSVCDDWHNFQVFAEWATQQIGYNMKGWHLDKDLLVKNNKVYSPETCVYLPQEINAFIKRYNFNGLPLGVDIAYNYDKTPYYRAQAREDGNNICLGRFSNVEDAFYAYKEHKEGLAKKLADKWKGKIDDRAVNALYNYTVEITD